MSKQIQIVLSDADLAAFGVVVAETGWALPYAIKALAHMSLEESAKNARDGVSDGVYASVSEAIRANAKEAAQS